MAESEQIVALMREVLMLCLKLVGPPLILSMIVGLIIAILQAATQIHEQTLTFVPKLLIIGLVLLLMGSWIFTNMNDFFSRIMQLMSEV